MGTLGLAALCAAVAVLCWMVPGHRLAVGMAAPPSGGGSAWAPGWLRGREGALPGGQRARVGVVLGAATMVVLPVAGWAATVVGLLVGVGGAVGLGLLEPTSARRARAGARLELPEALDLMAGALAAGLPLRGAARHVEAVGLEHAGRGLRQVLAQVGVGIPEPDAWRRLSTDPDWGPVARDLAVAAVQGTALVETLRRHAQDARERRRAGLLRQARAVGVRSTLPLMACFLPAFLLTGVAPVIGGLVGQLLHR